MLDLRRYADMYGRKMCERVATAGEELELALAFLSIASSDLTSRACAPDLVCMLAPTQTHPTRSQPTALKYIRIAPLQMRTDAQTCREMGRGQTRCEQSRVCESTLHLCCRHHCHHCSFEHPHFEPCSLFSVSLAPRPQTTFKQHYPA